VTQHILITGCSSGGKTTLINALSTRGHLVVPEPGLRIVQDERASGGTALPWVDMSAFLWRALEMAKSDFAEMATCNRPVFYDRGLLDAAVGLKILYSVPLSETIGSDFPYAPRIILTPPWREIFAQNEDRQHSFESATCEYNNIHGAINELSCEVVILPLVDVAERVAFVERRFC